MTEEETGQAEEAEPTPTPDVEATPEPEVAATPAPDEATPTPAPTPSDPAVTASPEAEPEAAPTASPAPETEQTETSTTEPEAEPSDEPPSPEPSAPGEDVSETPTEETVPPTQETTSDPAPTEGADAPQQPSEEPLEEPTEDLTAAPPVMLLGTEEEMISTAAAQDYLALHLSYGYFPWAAQKAGDGVTYLTLRPFAVEDTSDGKFGGYSRVMPYGYGPYPLLDSWDINVPIPDSMENVNEDYFDNYDGYPLWHYKMVTTVADAARIPDRQFGGWYIYNPEKNSNAPTVSSESSGYTQAENIWYYDGFTPLEPDDLFAEITEEGAWTYWPKGRYTGLVIVGNWIRSDDASALATVDLADGSTAETAVYAGGDPVTLYWEDISTLTAAELTGLTHGFDPAEDTYYLRVDPNVDSVDLDFLASEPYAFWGEDDPEGLRDDTGVSVKVTDTQGQTTEYASGDMTYAPLNQGEKQTTGTMDQYLTVNTADTPAASKWSHEIALTPSEGAGSYYNTVVVTITSPDGTQTKEYTFHIQRLNEPYIEQDPGNTPYGMIERYSAQEDWDTHKGYFSDTKATLKDLGLNVPDNKYYSGTYWGDLAIDTDRSGLVAYLNDTFNDPGVTVYNSVGDPIAPADLATHLTASLQVTQMTGRLDPQHILDPTTAASNSTQQTLRADTNGLWTIGGAVLPGTYSMEYVYKDDPYTGQDYSSDETDFTAHGSDYAPTFSRQVTILPLPGDVDMDGSVTPVDGRRLSKLAMPEWESATEPQRLYFYRVCDVTANGTNGGDVEELYGGYVPTYQTTTRFTLFYNPLDGATAPRQASQFGTGTGGLYLDYLGKRTDTTPPTATVKPAEDELKEGDLFWVGVRVDDWDSLNSAYATVGSVSLTLAYDYKYLTPAVFVNEDGTTSFQPLTSDNESDWINTIVNYNHTDSLYGGLGVLHAQANVTDADYDTKAERTDFTYGSIIREIKVTFGGSRTADLKTGYLLKIPFFLSKQPGLSKQVQAVTLSLGSGNFALELSNAGGDTRAAAWDTDGRLTGGFNLAEALQFDSTDEYSATTLYLSTSDIEYKNLTGTYGVPYVYEDSKLYGLSLTEGDLPDGLSFSGYTISGTPSKAGTYPFAIGTGIYLLEILPAELEVRPVDQAKYYGEANPTLTFQYNVDQIKGVDQPGGVNNPTGPDWTGEGSELDKLAGHVNLGTLTTEVVEDTAAGDYDIILSGLKNNNYTFVYLEPGEEFGTGDTNGDAAQAAATLTVMKRPIVVEKITAYPIATVPVDTNQLVFDNVQAVLDKGADGGFIAKLPDLDTDGKYKGYPLTGDPVLPNQSIQKLTISYTAAFTPDAGATGTDRFVLTQLREDRTMTLTNVRLVGGPSDWVNYELVEPLPTQGTGLVVQRPVEKLQFSAPNGDNGLSEELAYKYGDQISFANLNIQITHAAVGGDGGKTYTFKYDVAAPQYGLKAVLLDTPNDNPADADPDAEVSDGNYIDYRVHHGKYFCVYLESDPTKKVVSKVPFAVEKQAITLTVTDGWAYYGEEPNGTFSLGNVSYTYDVYDLAFKDMNKLGYAYNDLTGTAAELKTLLKAFGETFTEPTVAVHRASGSGYGDEAKAGNATDGTYLTVILGAAADNYEFVYVRHDDGSEQSDYGTNAFTIKPRPIVVEQVTMSVDDSAGATDYFLYDDTADVVLEYMYYTSGTVLPTAAATKSATPVKDTFTASLPPDRYYPAGGAPNAETLVSGSLTGDAIFGSDAPQVTYIATYTPDAASHPRFTLADENAQETRDVSVSALALTGDLAKNYELVYTGNATAMTCLPEQTGAQGLVKMRPIQTMAVVSDPTIMDYTYGQTLDLTGMAIQVTYTTEGDNTTTFQKTQIIAYNRINVDGVFTDSFEELGFQVQWESRPTDSAGFPLDADFGSDFTVVDHDGRTLVVTGSRHATHAVLTAETAKAVNIAKKTLTLTVEDQNRYYGEANGDSEFTFDITQMASRDQDYLTGEGVTATTGDQALLAAYFSDFVAPAFATDATQGADVGTYALTLTGGSMDNYDFECVDGTITVHPRPIEITAITGTDSTNPIYTIYYNDSQTRFSTFVDSTGTPGFTAALPIRTTPYPLTAPAIYNGDALRLSVDLEFPAVAARPDLDTNLTAPCYVTVTDVALATGGKSGNYVLETNVLTGGSTTVIGQLDNRTIDSMEITVNPTMDYVYRQNLDLSAMRVKLTYNSGVSNDSVTVIAERDGRIKIYYSDTATVSDVTGLREAKTGDHLTIAPRDGYTHQGKYLLVQATQLNTTAQATVMKDGDAIPIRITPLDLVYSLSAEDKAYDGTTNANGAVTLLNVYPGDDVSASATFHFLDENVHYEGYGYTTTPSADYWTQFQEDPLRDATNWHEAREVASMPVLVSGMTLSGADSANYVITMTTQELNDVKVGAEDTNRQPVAESGKVGLTDNVNSNRSTVPFATITRADRPAPQALPQVLVDDHTNVVKIDYDQSQGITNAVGMSAATNGGVADEYADETHLEYVLELKDGDEPVRLWAGEDGLAAAQDGRFFGGEAVTPQSPTPLEGAPVGGYVPDSGEFPSGEDMAEEDFVFQGQTYRWAAEDDGFYRDDAAYPGGAGYVRPGYSLYATDRAPLPKAATVWAGVRVAQTHNYNASEFTYSVSGESPEVRAEHARVAANEVAAELVDILKSYGDTEEWPTEDYEFVPGAHSAVNTYAQRIELISVADEKSAQADLGSGAGEYRVYTLEAVWFTNLMDYPGDTYMDGVVRNADPTRYYGYYWDENQSAELAFDVEDGQPPFSLKDPLTVTVEVEVDGVKQEQTTLVNEDNNAVIYVGTSSGDLTYEGRVTISPSSVTAHLGDDPITLTATVSPDSATHAGVTWTSSDESVATIDENGVLTFVGVGECTITARSYFGVSAKITVTVLEPETQEAPKQVGLFWVDYPEAYLWTDEHGAVDPARGVTRGELAMLLAQFCIPDEETSAAQGTAFPDLGGKNYTDAVNLLARYGIVNGTGSALFEGERLATRAEVVAMLCRMLCLELPEKVTGDLMFRDAGPEETWAWAYIEAMGREELTYGVGDGLFAPGREVTYAEVAVLLDRIVQRGLPLPEDAFHPEGLTEDHWAYGGFLKGLNTPPQL